MYELGVTGAAPRDGRGKGFWALAALLLLLGACVTINVYFPAAEVEKAADKIIDDVWGRDAAKPGPKPQSRRSVPRGHVRASLVELVFPSAHAAANIDVTSPAIEKLESSMRARHAQLSRYYSSGAVGLTGDGLIKVRSLGVVPIRGRQSVARLVAAENKDRKALYREIARANGHPEWEGDVRATFARRWIQRARSGWWYEARGQWRQK